MQARRKAKLLQADSVDLDALIASGEAGAYEALQLFRSRSLRALGKGENLSALSTMVEGAIKLIQGTYYAAATELCNQLLESLNNLESDIASPDIRDLVFAVDDALVTAIGEHIHVVDDFSEEKKGAKTNESTAAQTTTKANDIKPNTPAAALKVRKDFLKGAVRWVQSCGKKEFGDAALHVRTGYALWSSEQNVASYHFAVGEAPAVLAQKISDSFSNSSDTAKRDQSLTVAVCHFLTVENLRDANECVSQFKKAQKSRGNDVDTKLVTFCVQLLECCRRDAQPLFKQLMVIMEPEFKKWNSETVLSLLQGPIGNKYFGIQPVVHPMMQMMKQFIQ